MKAKKTRKFAKVKRMLNPKDKRLKISETSKAIKKKKKPQNKSELMGTELKRIEKERSSMFFAHNKDLGPPYNILVDTNFINFSIQYKLDIVDSMMQCLLAKCTPCVSDCVVAELEKLGHRYRLALKLTKDPRFRRLSCAHKGTYADDCIVSRIK